MIQNNNLAVITRMARSYMKSNKRRSITMILAVLLSSFMLFGVFTVGITFFKMQRLQNIRMNGSENDAILYGVTDEQMQICENDEEIKKFGIIAMLGSVSETAYDKTPDVALMWADETYWDEMAVPARNWMKGKYPTKENEVLVTRDALEKCGFEGAGIGDTIDFVYENYKTKDEEKSLRICGIWEGYGDTDAFYVSKKYYEQTGLELSDVSCGRLLIDFKARLMTKEQQNGFIEKMNLGKQQRLFYMADIGYSVQILGGMIGIVLVTCLCAYLLIYNIMYLAVAGNIRYYGLLQTIGMTGRQIHHFVRQQMLVVGSIGIVGGMILGSGVSFFLIPGVVKSLGIRTKQAGKIQISFHPAIFVLTIIFISLTVWIASRKPAKMAVKSSPMSALGYTPGTGVKKSRKTGRGKIIWRMAKEQITKDKKKSAVVIISLAAGLSVFLCMVTLISSQGARAYNYNYRDLDLVVKNDTVKKEKKEERIQIIDKDIIRKINDIGGVEEVSPVTYAEIIVPWEPEFTDIWMREFYETWMSIPYEDEVEEYKEHPENFGSSLVGITDTDFKALNETLETPIDEKAFLNGKTCLIYRNGLFELKEKEVKGKKVTCAQYENEENTRTFEMAALIDDSAYTALLGFPPTIIVTDKVVKEFVKEPMIAKIGVGYKKEYDEETESKIHGILDNTSHARDFGYESKIEQKKNVEKAQGNMMQVGIGIVAILAFIGIMNYMNTSVGNIQSRQVELSVMESIGMTEKQMEKMLIAEAALYVGGAWILTLTAGLGITYYLFQSMNYRETPFSIPVLPMIGAAVLILLVCIMVPVKTYHSLEKKAPVVERIRGFE